MFWSCAIVEIFRFCDLTDLSRNYRPDYGVFLIPFLAWFCNQVDLYKSMIK